MQRGPTGHPSLSGSSTRCEMTDLQERIVRRRLADCRQPIAPFPWTLFWIVALAAVEAVALALILAFPMGMGV